MKEWIEHHKRILQKAASALLAFVVGVCLVFMIHPVKTLPKDRLLSLSRMQEDSQQFVASSSKEPALEDLLSLDLAREEGKTQKNWVTLSAFVKKIGKAASFTQEDTTFGTQVQLGYGTPVQGIHPYTIEFQKQDDTFSISEQKELKTGRFYRLSDTRWKKGKGDSSRRCLEKIRSSKFS